VNMMSKTLSLLLLLLGIPGFNSPEAQNPRISEWVEDAPASDADRIALGYPVPIPVDTPLPFDGFRSYSGLHTRHQDLANTTAWSHAIEIGQTRMGRTIWAYQLGDADHLTLPSRQRQRAGHPGTEHRWFFANAEVSEQKLDRHRPG